MKIHTDGTIDRNHPDLEILATCTEVENYPRSSHGSTLDTTYEGHYFRVRYLRYWGQESIKQLEEQFAEANSKTSEYRFELINTEDWEMEFDEDRYWEASFTFLAHKK